VLTARTLSAPLRCGRSTVGVPTWRASIWMSGCARWLSGRLTVGRACGINAPDEVREPHAQSISHPEAQSQGSRIGAGAERRSRPSNPRSREISACSCRRRGTPLTLRPGCRVLAAQGIRCEGIGVWSGDRRLATRATSPLRGAIAAIGDYAIGPGAARKNETQLAATVSLTLPVHRIRVHRIRMLATVALDFAWIAAGCLDAPLLSATSHATWPPGSSPACEVGAADADGSLHVEMVRLRAGQGIDGNPGSYWV
jgi:hypothetical protein